MNLDLQMLTTVAGAVIFIELVMELFYKPIVKNLTFGNWADAIKNVVAFIIGLIGTLGAGSLIPGAFTPQGIAELALVALIATASATLGYEFVKNLGDGAGA